MNETPVNLFPAQREDLRIVVLGYLAARNTAAFDSEQIAQVLRRRRGVDFPFTPADVESALTFLDSQGWTTLQESPFGTSRARIATARGVLEAERRGLC